MNASWSDRTFTREALAGHLYASPPAQDFGEVSQYYGAPILDNAGNVAGALVVRVAVQELWDALGTPQNVLLVDEDGVRIADRSAARQVFVALTPLGPDLAARVVMEQRYGAQVPAITATNVTELAAAVKRGDATALTYRDAKGQMVRAAIRRARILPWTVVVFETEDTVFASERTILLAALALGAVAMVAGALMFAAARGVAHET
ncbi:MAG: cache domain-containing protein, partial [Chloroflexota bacterium]|nr:cache domain-containing protein [Chloroflexota bacterium]